MTNKHTRRTHLTILTVVLAGALAGALAGGCGVNPITGEDYSATRRGDILCGHNLWISNTTPAKKWNFLTVVYPLEPGAAAFPKIERLDDHTVRVGEDVISFDPKTAASSAADFIVDVEMMRPTRRK